MALADFTPTKDDVAFWLRARLVSDYGQDKTTFDSQTTPTGDQVDGIIEQAVETLSLEIGDLDAEDASNPECLEENLGKAKKLAALYGAMIVELSFFPEQTTTDRSPYRNLKDQFDERLPALKKSIDKCFGEGGEGGSDSGHPARLPAFSFGNLGGAERRT